MKSKSRVLLAGYFNLTADLSIDHAHHLINNISSTEFGNMFLVLLFSGMVIYDNEFEKKRKIK